VVVVASVLFTILVSDVGQSRANRRVSVVDDQDEARPVRVEGEYVTCPECAVSRLDVVPSLHSLTVVTRVGHTTITIHGPGCSQR
jgi:hypothetical protein